MESLQLSLPDDAERVALLRRETPGCRERNHLNNAGAALMPGPVLRAVREHLDLESRVGGYEAADLRREAVEGVYDDLARLLGCHPGNLAVTENATAAFVQALSSVPFRSGDVIVTTRHDYASNQIQYLSLAERFGVEVVRAPDAPDGGVDVGAVEGLVHRRRPRLVAVSHVP
ncbi:MAG: aminotransferase class V-fold PLP-dependent enzyme, partial [Gemmatimonadota bacterium]